MPETLERKIQDKTRLLAETLGHAITPLVTGEDAEASHSKVLSGTQT